MRIFLIGFMGSGKSTIGRQLAEALSYDFVDLDMFIEKSSGQTIPQLFEISQTHFRYIEYNALRKVIKENRRAVIALGGGTPCYFNSMSAVLENGQSVYLKVSPETLVQRLKGDLTRPLVQNKTEGELFEYVKNLLSGREVYYQRANLTINADCSNDELLDELISFSGESTKKER